MIYPISCATYFLLALVSHTLFAARPQPDCHETLVPEPAVVCKGDPDSNRIYALAFSPDGKSIASGTGSKTILWDATTGKQIREFAEPFSGHCLVFSPNGQLLAAGCREKGYSNPTVVIWDLKTGKEVRKFPHIGTIYCVAFSPDGKSLACGGEGQVVKTTMGEVDLGSSGELVVWNVDEGKKRLQPVGFKRIVGSVAFTPDGKSLFAGDVKGQINVWDAATGKLQGSLKGHDDFVRSVSFSADGKILATCSDDWSVRTWDVETRKQTGIKEKMSNTYSVSLSVDGKLMACGRAVEGVGYCHLLQVDGLKELVHVKLERWALSVAFSPDGKRFASSDGGDIKIWETAKLIGAGK